MSKSAFWRACVAASFCVLFLSSPANADSVNIYAAASTSDAIEAVIEAYGSPNGGQIVPVFAGTSTLARQIQQGAPADIFLAANEAWVDELEAENNLAVGTRVDLLTNRLVLVTPRLAAIQYDFGSATGLSASLGSGRLALADPGGVPAGIYAEQALTARGEWDSVQDQLVYGDSVRTVLRWVASSEVSAAVVYESDALSTMSVAVLGTYPATAHDPIRYPLAIVAGSETRPAVLAFHAYLQTPTARHIFEDYGFGLADSD